MENNTTSTASTLTANPYEHSMRPSVAKILAMAGSNPFRYAYGIERLFRDELKERSGYESFTTFVSDFCLAEPLGDAAIRETFERAKKEWIGLYKYATELTLAVNWLCWFWYANKDEELSSMYAKMYYDMKDSFYEYNEIRDTDSDEEADKKREAVDYFFQTTD